MVFPQLNPARIFGTVEHLEFFIVQGYETGAFGRGEWIGDKRIVAIWVLKGLGLPIKVSYQPEIGPSREKGFASEEELDEFIRQWKISIFGETSLVKLLNEFFQTQALQTAGEIEEFLQGLYELGWRQADSSSFSVWLYRHNLRLGTVHYDGRTCHVQYYEETMPASEAELLSEVLKCKFDFESVSLSTL